MNFNRTAIDSEKEFRKLRFENDVKFCKEEMFSSINHALISFEKFLEDISQEDTVRNKDHIDNVYYHIGKLKALV